MRNLLNFLIKNISWFVFVGLELICFYFIFNTQSYQQSVFLNSSNQVSGYVYRVTSGVSSYFGLKKENEELLIVNAQLQNDLTLYKEHLARIDDDNIIENNIAFVDSIKNEQYISILARVVNNSTTRTRNFITINKGSRDGIKSDMGVISHQGLVGIVRAVSGKYSVIQPILNPDTKLSCKVLSSNVSGTLIWNGEDSRYANIIDYPKFEAINKGDTIISSGYSEVFPEGIMVGIVESYENQFGDNFFNIKVKLATDFNALKNVIIIENKAVRERVELENNTRSNVKS